MRVARLFFLLGCIVAFRANSSMSGLDINLVYVQYLPSAISQPLFLKQRPADLGISGAQLGIADSNTTGKFLQHHYSLTPLRGDDLNSLIDSVVASVGDKPSLIVADLPASGLLTLTNKLKPTKSLVINAGSAQNSLRVSQCATGLLHTVASTAMLTDALGQFMMAKRWRKWFVLSGESTLDTAYLESLKRTAKRFGVKITEQKNWTFDTDLRRAAQREVPLMTQGSDYDAVVVVDEQDVFGDYIPFNTWLPRPVVGTHGLTAMNWHWTVEQWGAVQLQNRFYETASRDMRDTDYSAWLAIRAIAEAVTRTSSNLPATLYAYMLSEGFELAAFKGRKLNFRPWNGQLRQPIALIQPNALVSQSPQEGYLHPLTDLDTLGFDKPEVSCTMANRL